MALIKTKVLQNGDKVSYWKWIDTNKSRHRKTSNYVLGGWENKEARENYPDFPKDQYNFNWSGSDFPFDISELNKVNMNDEVIAYEKAKESILLIEDEVIDVEEEYTVINEEGEEEIQTRTVQKTIEKEVESNFFVDAKDDI